MIVVKDERLGTLYSLFLVILLCLWSFGRMKRQPYDITGSVTRMAWEFFPYKNLKLIFMKTIYLENRRELDLQRMSNKKHRNIEVVSYKLSGSFVISFRDNYFVIFTNESSRIFSSNKKLMSLISLGCEGGCEN